MTRNTTNGGNDMQGTETYFARILEACATGATVQESIADAAGYDWRGGADADSLTPETARAIADASSAACDVAAEMFEQGLDAEDLDESWTRLRGYVLGLRPDSPLRTGAAVDAGTCRTCLRPCGAETPPRGCC